MSRSFDLPGCARRHAALQGRRRVSVARASEGAFHLDNPPGLELFGGIARPRAIIWNPRQTPQRLPGLHRKDLGKSLLGDPTGADQDELLQIELACGGKYLPAPPPTCFGNERPEPQCLELFAWSASRKDIST
ncbi:hypothetical protein ACPL4A_29825 [Pseudomonas aeruginosa]|uniref:hypothetical protein n=1 Tax=Pseudomonas aeruginosa TaxID=287 RepID=UPI003C742944